MNKKPTITYPQIYYRLEHPVIKTGWFKDRVEDILYWFESLFEDKNKPESSGAWCGTYRLKIRDDVLAQWEAEDEECVERH